jgi:site-specific DNA recombinase
MPSTNSHGPKRAILYARVSTDEQARSGYSLAQQLEALRGYANREGYKVFEEVRDPGQSGVSLERPGMDRVRDLVAAGGVSVVLAQDRDRFAREPAYHYLLRREFEEYGTKIRALNDRGDDSPEGELTDGILDQLAKFERAKTAERTRRGKLRKAREGKLIASHTPKYGFRFDEGRTGYLVDDVAMRVVRRIIEMVASGTPMWRVKTTLEAEEVPAPGGGKRWSQTTLRQMLRDDSYRPHSTEELSSLGNLPAAVVAALDPKKRYGVSWYGRRRTKVRPVAEFGPDGERRYRNKQETTIRPREEWIGVPVPDSGIPRSLVDAARDAIRENARPSSAGRRFWELSGGVAACGECGRYLRQTHRKHAGKEGVFYNYYGCPSTQNKTGRVCRNGKGRRAEELEEWVWEFVSSLLKDPQRLKSGLEEMIEAERAGMRGDPEHEAKAWLEKLSEVEQERRGYLRLAAKGHMSDDELDEALAELENTRKAAERELEALQSRQKVLEELEKDKDALLESYAQMTPAALDALTPDKRQRIYKILRLKVYTHADGTTELRGVFSPSDEFYGVDITSPPGARPASNARARSCTSPTTRTWSSWPPKAELRRIRSGG